MTSSFPSHHFLSVNHFLSPFLKKVYEKKKSGRIYRSVSNIINETMKYFLSPTKYFGHKNMKKYKIVEEHRIEITNIHETTIKCANFLTFISHLSLFPYVSEINY